MMTKRIESIEFHILSPDMIRKMSSIEIKTPDTYDKDGYPMEGGLMDPHLGVINPSLRCKTCGQKMKQCPGHFGSLELTRPIIQPKFGKNLEMLMQSTCRSCGKISLKEEQIKELQEQFTDKEELAKAIVKKAKTKKKCIHCDEKRELVVLDKPTNFYIEEARIYPNQIREWIEKIQEKDLSVFGYELERIRPEWFIMTVLQVPPITIRPSITLESGIKSEDDLTHKLVDVIRINMRLKDNIDAGAPQLIIEDLWDLLQYHVTTYFDNNTAGVPPAKHRSGRPLRTLVQRLKGKKGRFRYNLTGKRVNYAARSTITPDQFISINEVGVPEEIAKTLTVPEVVTEWNIENLKKAIKSGCVQYVTAPNGLRKKVSELNMKEVLEEFAIGGKIERDLQDGDIVLFNRQPSLHRLSMMAHNVKVMPNKTLRLHPIVCKPYNADFDGDEMNLQVPQTEEGKAEARELMFVQNQIISPRYGGPVIVPAEDLISAPFVLTLKQTKFKKDDAMKYLYEMGITELPKPEEGKEFSGKQIFSAMLPEDLNLDFDSSFLRLLSNSGALKEDYTDQDAYEADGKVKIENGKLIHGVIDKNALGEPRGYLVDEIARKYPAEVITLFYRNLSRVGSDLLTMKGLSVGLNEFYTSTTIDKVKEKAVEEELKTGQELVEKYKKGQLDIIPGKNLDETLESLMIGLGMSTKKKVEKQILSEKIREVIGDKPRMNSHIITFSGARGGSVNLVNLLGFFGQVNVRDGRPKRGFTKRLVTLDEKGDIGPIARGFVKHGFMEGLSSKEYFLHSMGGRQGEVDTSVSTKVSGYLYRRLANALKDLVINNDETVRTANKNIIQFIYGEDGVFPSKTKLGVVLKVEDFAKKKKGKD